MTGDPKTAAYLKFLLAAVADLTQAADADLANPQFNADLAAFRNGERADLPNGQTRDVLNRLAAEPATRKQSRLRGLALREVRNPFTVPTCHNPVLFVVVESLDASYVELRKGCERALSEGALSPVPGFPDFWSILRYVQEAEEHTGPLLTNRRPRMATHAEAADALAYLLATFSQCDAWDFHNQQVERIQQVDDSHRTDSGEILPAQLEYVEALKAVHYRDALEEADLGWLMRMACPQFLEDMPKPIPEMTTVDATERAQAYLKLEARVLTELRHREAADRPNAGNPPTVSNVEPLANTEVNGTKANGQTEPQFIFRPDGNGFYLEGFGERGHFKSLKGLADLWRLVQSPGVGVVMLELDAGMGTKRAVGDGQSRQPIIEADELRLLNTARKRYQAEVDDAENDTERRDSQEMLNKCIEAIRAMTGNKGKPRDLNNPNDRLRPKIDGRIKTACNAVQITCPKLAEHFAATCSADGPCYVYSPGIARLKWDTSEK